MNVTLLNEINNKSPEIGRELMGISHFVSLDPDAAVIKARKALELIVEQIEFAHGSNLSERISALSHDLPDSVVTYMHFVRRLGNTAAHSGEKVSNQVAKDVENVMTYLACWHLDIDPRVEKSPKARFFIAEGVYRTWPKVAVLTDDGVLYSEYLTYMKPTKFQQANFDFNTFTGSDFSFGEKEHGRAYQPLREVSFQEAANFPLRSQVNWVKKYVQDKNISIS